MDANELLIRKLFDLFGRRHLDDAVALFAHDAAFHVPGRSAISGTYRGRDGVRQFWRRQIERSQGSFRTQLGTFDSEDDHVVVNLLISAERSGSEVSWRRTVDYRIVCNRIVEATVVEGDQAKADEFFGPPG